ncbi:hypothetical protein KAT08_03960 [Candidatus Babeliales bacterium]|nr:hypothetical protein [Candidatus Babeliales bacterium]
MINSILKIAKFILAITFLFNLNLFSSKDPSSTTKKHNPFSENPSFYLPKFPQDFKEVRDAQLKQFSVGKNYVWGVNYFGEIFQSDITKNITLFSKIEGPKLKQISVGYDNSVWGIDKKGKIYRYNNKTNSWKRIRGNLEQISVGNENYIFGIDKNNILYQWKPKNFWWKWKHFKQPKINSHPIKIKHVAVGNDKELWIISKDGSIWKWKKSKWKKIYEKSIYRQISIGDKDHIAATTTNNKAFIYDPNEKDFAEIKDEIKYIFKDISINQDNIIFLNKSEKEKLIKLSIGKNYIWGINNEGKIFKSNDITDKKTKIFFSKIEGPELKQISVGYDNLVWGIDKKSNAHGYNDKTNSWNKISGDLEQISVGNKKYIFGINKDNILYQWKPKKSWWIPFKLPTIIDPSIQEIITLIDSATKQLDSIQKQLVSFKTIKFDPIRISPIKMALKSLIRKFGEKHIKSEFKEIKTLIKKVQLRLNAIKEGPKILDPKTITKPSIVNIKNLSIDIAETLISIVKLKLNKIKNQKMPKFTTKLETLNVSVGNDGELWITGRNPGNSTNEVYRYNQKEKTWNKIKAPTYFTEPKNQTIRNISVGNKDNIVILIECDGIDTTAYKYDPISPLYKWELKEENNIKCISINNDGEIFHTKSSINTLKLYKYTKDTTTELEKEKPSILSEKRINLNNLFKEIKKLIEKIQNYDKQAENIIPKTTFLLEDKKIMEHKKCIKKLVNTAEKEKKDFYTQNKKLFDIAKEKKDIAGLNISKLLEIEENKLKNQIENTINLITKLKKKVTEIESELNKIKNIQKPKKNPQLIN